MDLDLVLMWCAAYLAANDGPDYAAIIAGIGGVL